MSIFNKFTNSLNIFKQQEQSTIVPTGYEVQSYSSSTNATKNASEYLKEMKGWVGACVNAIADEIASIELKLFRINKDDIEEITEHEVLNLLYRVNDVTTKFDHFWLTQAYLELTGEAPWFLEKSGNSIKNIYFLKPDKLTPVVGEDRLVSGYKYQLGDRSEVRLPLDQVLFLKYPDPANPFRGIGSLRMAAKPVDIDNFSEEWNQKFYENSAHPDSILSVKTDSLSQEQLDKLKNNLKDQYQGYKNAHKVLILFGDYDFKQIGFSQKDMDFLEQQKFSRDKILGIFRVPKAIVSQTEGVNFASAKVAQYIFARYTIKPKMERMIQQLNEFLLPMFSGTEKMFLGFDNPVPEDSESKSQLYKDALMSGWMTINEVRSKENLPEIQGGDDIYLPLNVAPIGSKPEQQQPQKFIKLSAPRKTITNKSERIKEVKARSSQFLKLEKLKTIEQDLRKRVVKEIRKEFLKTKNNKTHKLSNDDNKSFFWKSKDGLVDKFLPQLTTKLISVFQSQRKSTLRKFNNLKAIKLDANSVYNKIKLDKKKEIAATMKVSIPVLEELFKESGDLTYELIDYNEEIDLAKKEIENLIKDNSKKFSTAVVDATNDSIKEQLAIGFKNGESVTEIKNRIREIFVNAEEFRADRIARTETVRYNNLAAEYAYEDSGIVEAKEWFTNPDACEFCRPLNGKTINLKDNFFDEGDSVSGDLGGNLGTDYGDVSSPPLHPNCRCITIPVFKESKKRDAANSKLTKLRS